MSAVTKPIKKVGKKIETTVKKGIEEVEKPFEKGGFINDAVTGIGKGAENIVSETFDSAIEGTGSIIGDLGTATAGIVGEIAPYAGEILNGKQTAQETYERKATPIQTITPKGSSNNQMLLMAGGAIAIGGLIFFITKTKKR